MLFAPKAVIFDLDGTLLDSLEDIADAANHALGEAGLPTHPVAAYRYFVGEGMPTMIRKAAPHISDTTSLVASAKAVYATGWGHKTHLYPGITEMLGELASLGIPCAVLSNKPHDFTKAMIDHFFPEAPFAIVRGHKEPTPLKPHPQSAVDIAESLGVDPASVYFVGDSKIDMETANRASMVAVGVTWGFRDEAELREHKAHAIIRHPRELSGCWHGC